MRIGTGSGSQSDPVAPVVDMVERGDIQYLVYDCQSERTYIDQVRRLGEGGLGYDEQLSRKLSPVLPSCYEKQIGIVCNGGGADLDGALSELADLCMKAAIKARIATIGPANIMDLVRRLDPVVRETGSPVSAFGSKLIAAQAYQGSRPIVEGLEGGSTIILSSRAGDAAQYLAPMVHTFGWDWNDWDRLASGLSIGHLLECGGQLSGGFFADPGKKDIEGLASIGFPIADVAEDGTAVLCKVAGSGGAINLATCKEQLVYELGDPGSYVHNDAVVDVRNIRFEELEPNVVRVSGTVGRPRPGETKVALGVEEGYMAVGRIAYAGRGCVARARLAEETVRTRLTTILAVSDDNLRTDILGVNTLFPWSDIDEQGLKEVVLRVAGRFPSLSEAHEMIWGIDQLTCNGPAAGGIGLGVDYSGISEVVGYFTTFVPSDQVPTEVHVHDVG